MITPECLRSVRQARGLSIEAVAELAGYAPGTVWRLEQGRAVRWQVLVDVALALGVLHAGRGTGANSPVQVIECMAC